MTTALILLFYLPMGLVPAILPSRILTRLAPAFAILSFLPISAAAVAFALARPLLDWLGYSAAFVPLSISLLSFAIAVVGIRVTLLARREGKSIMRPSLTSAIAAVPFGVTLPFLISAAISIVVNLLGA